MSGLRSFERLSEIAHGLGERVAIEHRSEQFDVEVWKEPTALRSAKRSLRENVDFNDSFAPVPDFLDAQFAVDLQLVDAAPCPLDFDRELWAFPRLRSKDIALIGFGGALVLFSRQRPTAERPHFDATIDAPRVAKVSDVRLDLLMILRRTHDLDFPLQIADAGRRVIATNVEQVLVVFPRDIVNDDDVIGIRRGVVFAKRGGPRHDESISPSFSDRIAPASQAEAHGPVCAPSTVLA